MNMSFNKDIVKKVIFIGVNYMVLMNILCITIYTPFYIISGDSVIIQKHSLIAFLWAMTIPPIWEELFFRKYLYSKLKTKVKTAMIISSAIFGLLHFTPIIIIIALGVGIISCKIYEQTNDIKYSILFHSISNLTTGMMYNTVNHNIVNGDFDLYQIQSVLVIILVLSIVCYKKYSSKFIKNIYN